MYIHSYNYDESEYLLNALSRYKNKAWYLNVMVDSFSKRQRTNNLIDISDRSNKGNNKITELRTIL